MHKKICYAIKYVVRNTPYNSDNIFRVDIHRKKTDGFWSMDIVFGGGNGRFAPHLIEIAKSIGLFYGETVWITEELDFKKRPYKLVIR